MPDKAKKTCEANLNLKNPNYYLMYLFFNEIKELTRFLPIELKLQHATVELMPEHAVLLLFGNVREVYTPAQLPERKSLLFKTRNLSKSV